MSPARLHGGRALKTSQGKMPYAKVCIVNNSIELRPVRAGICPGFPLRPNRRQGGREFSKLVKKRNVGVLQSRLMTRISLSTEGISSRRQKQFHYVVEGFLLQIHPIGDK